MLGAPEIGGGKTSLQKLCAYLNMPSPMSEDRYATTVKTVKESLQASTVESTKATAMEEKSKDEIEECKAMFDRTWRKHGYSSLQGAVTVISAKIGKCLDYETDS